MNAAVRDRLGPVGVWLAPPMLAAAPVDAQRRAVARIEELGYGSVWTGELPSGGREIFAQLAVLLAATERITVGAGIANIIRRDAGTMASAAGTLAEAYPDRLVLGLGGHAGRRQMTAYLDALPDDAPGPPVPTVLAALGPRMLEVAAKRTDGAHPFLMPAANTARARAILGPEPLLIPEQTFVLDTDAGSARERFRELFSGISPDSSYGRNLRRLGYDDADLADGRSDRVIDDLLAHGDPDTVAARLHEHHTAGADDVLAMPLSYDLTTAVDHLTRLAPAVLPAER